MKKLLIVLAFLLAVPTGASAQEYYECAVAFDPSKGEACEAYRGRVHMCQLYDWSFTSGVPSHCSGFCLNRSGIPAECATVVVRQSNNPEAHEARRGGGDSTAPPAIPISNELLGELEREGEALAERIDPDDGISAEEAQDIMSTIIDFFSGLIGEKVEEVKDDIAEGTGTAGDEAADFIDTVKEKIIGGEDDEETTDESIEFDEEDPFAPTGLDAVDAGEYDFEKWPDEDGTKIAKIVDAYGVERYTSDGKHFYDKPYDAAHSGEGVSNIVNSVKDTWGNFTGFFFKTKLEDKDKELQREIARELLNDTKSQSEKDVEKAYEKLSGTIKAPTLGDTPAKVIVTVAKETSETDFAEGVMLYIEEREKGKGTAEIRENSSELLSGGYGTFGGGTSLSTTNKQAETVLYARYEEAYQRYKIAKEFGRTE